ncbi:hypothetical protein CSUB01_04095 [Colletotrichum sublineola]|uniref:Uncharacterized protein n=1 Tax=Colletotrichum sublineola TaxID=1173701 RepID=A0A066WVM6_COLSU|nr:hypothetical protein CSUB01_04095 [Colletotrichum sublineola]
MPRARKARTKQTATAPSRKSRRPHCNAAALTGNYGRGDCDASQLRLEPTLLCLPSETLTAVAVALVESPDTCNIRRRTILSHPARLCLVSRTWNAIATPVLYTQAAMADARLAVPYRPDMPFKVSPRTLRDSRKHHNRPAARDCDFSRATPPHAAVRSGHEETVDWLLQQGIQVDGQAFLCCLCPSSYAEVFQYQSVRELSTVSTTPLQLALACGLESIAKMLLTAGAIWDRPFSFSAGTTALHMMAAGGMIDLIDWLADGDTGERLNDWPDNWGRSALHYASFIDMRATRTLRDVWPRP